jgi:hypothetical protein
MADKDITFYGDIKIDTLSAKNSIDGFLQQTERLFERTSKKMTQTLVSGRAFNFAKHLSDYGEGLNALKDIYGKHVEALASRIRRPSNTASAAEQAWAKTINASVAKDMDKLRRGKMAKVIKLYQAMEMLSPYATVYPDITALAKSIDGGKIDPKVGLGRYGYLQHENNRVVSLIYKLKKWFPDIFTQETAETAESFRDRNRINGIKSREEVRFVQKRSYRDKATQRALNYLWYRGDLRELNDIYGLGISPTTKRTPPVKLMEQKPLEENQTWVAAGMYANALRRSLAAGGMTPTQEKTTRKEIDRQMGIFIKGFQKAYPDLHEAALGLKAIREGLKEKKSVFGVNNAVWTVLGGKVAKDVFGGASDMLQSYWGESITRNAYASRQAYLSRWTTGGKIVGNVLGGVLGAFLTPFLGPGAMGVGYVAGGELGKLGGTYNETKYKADIKSSTDMMARIRNKALWGSEYNTYFAKALTDIGIANGESAMGGLADRSMSFRARMMLGQVGEQEMLYMSMMPNYYAALMGGMTGPELLNIYKRDLDAIGDPSMRYLVGQAIGNTEAFAAANNPYFGTMYPSLVNQTSAAESSLTRVQPGFVSGRWGAALETLERDVSEIFASVRRGDSTIYRGEGVSRTYQMAQDQAKMMNFRVNVFVNGEEIQRNTNNDQVFLNDLQLYTVGG